MNMAMIQIRPADTRDIRAIEKLNREVQAIHIKNYPHIFKETSPDEVIRWIKTQFRTDDASIFVAIKGNDIVGYILMKLYEWPESPFTYSRKFAYIDHICVTESERGHGIGRELMNQAIEYAKSRGFDSVELDVWHKNSDAVSAFDKIGFKTCREVRVLQKDKS